jgi:hypothetical protein
VSLPIVEPGKRNRVCDVKFTEITIKIMATKTKTTTKTATVAVAAPVQTAAPVAAPVAPQEQQLVPLKNLGGTLSKKFELTIETFDDKAVERMKFSIGTSAFPGEPEMRWYQATAWGTKALKVAELYESGEKSINVAYHEKPMTNKNGIPYFCLIIKVVN